MHVINDNSITSVPIRKINQFRKNIFIRIYIYTYIYLYIIYLTFFVLELNCIYTYCDKVLLYLNKNNLLFNGCFNI